MAEHPSKKAWRLANPDKDKAAHKRLNERRRQIKDAIKTQYGCMNPACPCEKGIPAYCLDFHHLHDKLFDIGCHAQKGMKALVAEINKCTVLCAVCHRMEKWGDLDASGFEKCQVDCEGNVLTRRLEWTI
jgi:hypothetical protein